VGGEVQMHINQRRTWISQTAHQLYLSIQNEVWEEAGDDDE